MYVRMDTVRCLESTWQHNKPNGHRLHELGVEFIAKTTFVGLTMMYVL